MHALATLLLRLIAVWLLATGLLPYVGSIAYGTAGGPGGSAQVAIPVVQLIVWIAMVLTLFLAAPATATRLVPKRYDATIVLEGRELEKVGFLLLGAFMLMHGIAQLTRFLPETIVEIAAATRDHGHVLDLNYSWYFAGPGLTQTIGGALAFFWAIRR